MPTFCLGFSDGPVLNFVVWVNAFILAGTERMRKMNDSMDLDEIHINFIEHA